MSSTTSLRGNRGPVHLLMSHGVPLRLLTALLTSAGAFPNSAGIGNPQGLASSSPLAKDRRRLPSEATKLGIGTSMVLFRREHLGDGRELIQRRLQFLDDLLGDNLGCREVLCILQ